MAQFNDEQSCRTFHLELGKETYLLKGKELMGYVSEQVKLWSDRCLLAQEREREREKEITLARMAHELEMAKLEAARERPQGQDRVDQALEDVVKCPRQVVMPPFDQKAEDIDEYISQFERIAATQQLPPRYWVTNLLTLLPGTARSVCNSMPNDQRDIFEDVKRVLLHHYKLSAESFLKLFRETSKRDTETHAQFHERLRIIFGKWIHMAEIPRTFEALEEAVIREQVLKTYRKELVIFLAERQYETLNQLAEAADRFEEAHSRVGPTERNVRAHLGNRQRPNGRQGNHNWKKGNNDQDVPEAKKTSSGDNSEAPQKKVVCFNCNRPGHIARECRKPTKPLNVGTVVQKGADVHSNCHNENTAPAIVNGHVGKVLYDTGCSYPVLVLTKHVKKSDITRGTVLVRYANSCEDRLPIAWVDIETPYVKGRVKAACVAALACDLVLGCRYVLPQPNPATCYRATVAAVETRAQKRKRASTSEQVAVSPIPVTNLLPGELRNLQQEDPTLGHCIRKAQSEGALEETTKKGAFMFKNGILYRQASVGNAKTKQLVVPQSKRSEVLSLAHEGLFGGHMGMRKTLDRVLNVFYWPGVGSDVKRHCRSCDRCQRTSLKGSQRPVPLGRVPVVDEPFRCVAMDLVGPIKPATDRGHQYILTVMDQATRYPECVALRRIDTEAIAEALWGIWARFGTPKEILTDQGPQFMSDLMEGVNRLLSIKHHAVSVWHPCGNGMIERFNKTLKHSLKKLCAQQPKDWDRYLPAVLFAYREVPQASTGFSPFEMLYGRRVRGPMAILRQLWTDEKVEGDTRTAYQYVTELRHQIETVCQLAQENIAVAQGKQERLYNKKAAARSYQPGDWVLLLLPTQHNKLQLEWQGPYKVLGEKGGHTYKVLVKGKTKVFHANLLKRYVNREEPVVVATVVYEDVDTPETSTNSLPSCPLESKETYKQVEIGKELSAEQKAQMEDLLHQYRDIWTDVPGRTNLAEFEVNLTSDVPIQCKPYPLPHAKRNVVKQEVAAMIAMGVIEPARSAYSSPIVLVRKKDQTHRFCIDFRRLNKVTEFEVEPLPDSEYIYAKVAKAHYFTKIDLSKGYWQVPVREADRHKLAFTTPDATYQWLVMPFGVQNAPSVFSRMMRKLLEPFTDKPVYNFMDDLLIATETWQEHLGLLEAVMKRLRETGLTARPTKCKVGFSTIDYLGHTLTQGKLAPDAAKVKQLKDAPQPRTKTEVRSFLGFAGYYRRHIPDFSTTASPLTNLTKKSAPNKVVWTDECEIAFQRLKTALTTESVLMLPDLERNFVLRTDASESGLGAVLLQEHEGILHPVAYGSRKLNSAERNYSVTEKECLAVIFGISKFERYLYGRKFTLQVDHQPLAYLGQAKLTNGRLMRWSLYLQQYNVHVQYIKGSDNIGSDYLSRMGMSCSDTPEANLESDCLGNTA